jgi:predicted aspartyl protease
VRTRSVVLSLVFAGLWINFAAARSFDSVPFTLSEAGAVVVAATIDGAGPFAFLVDTGSSRSAVTRETAVSLGLPAIAFTSVVTAAGAERCPVVRLNNLALGGTRVDALLAPVVPSARLMVGGRRVDGIVGQDFLSGFNYTLDYRARRLVWNAAPEPDGVRLTLHRSEGRFLVELPQGNGSDVALTMVPDSGADGLVLFARAGVIAALQTSGPRDAGVVAGVGGAGLAQSVRVRELRIGGVTWRNRTASVIDRSEPDAPEGDGLLPLHTFGRVSFNSSEGYVVFERW